MKTSRLPQGESESRQDRNREHETDLHAMNEPNVRLRASQRSWKLILVSVGVLVIVLFYGGLIRFQHDSTPKFRINLHRVSVRTEHLKPPQEENVFDMCIENYGDLDLWFVWSDSPDQQFPEDFHYMSSGESCGIEESSIDCTKLMGHGTIRLIEFLGNRGSEDSFHALLLKPGARFACKRFPLVSCGSLDRLVVRVTPSLMVDGTTPLENWLPFDPGNYGEIYLDSSTYEFGSGLNRGTRIWKPGKGIPDFLRLRPKYIEVKPTDMYVWEPEK
ncbi:MAG: hypothetical protein J0M04_06395 [Verrucomicrobia bacterium]|nr:hypothetical protein [Verrucomicrobiota bacterium]